MRGKSGGCVGLKRRAELVVFGGEQRPEVAVDGGPGVLHRHLRAVNLPAQPEPATGNASPVSHGSEADVSARLYVAGDIASGGPRQSAKLGASLKRRWSRVMLERRTARVVLVSPEGRVLLMRIASVDGEAIWVTIGGRIEDGEDVHAAALREVVEETGQVDVAMGPAIWFGEQVLNIAGQPTRFVETFVLAVSDDESLSCAGWTAVERGQIEEMRWWSLGHLRETTEIVLPRALVSRLPQILGGRVAAEPELIDLT